MTFRRSATFVLLLVAFGPLARAQTGSISGTIHDKDFEAPIPLAQVKVVDPETTVESNDQGGFVIVELKPGRYTLIFGKGDEFIPQVRNDVVVTAGQVTELDVWLAPRYTEMEEYVVQDTLTLAAGTEAALLDIRFESPALLDSIGAEFISASGAGDAASALKFVAGASVKDGKSAVIRGLPDRYVSSQINGVRVPTSDEDKRAVELDQFPSAVIEALIVSKTFTPDQQGDASGGAVNVKLKGIPNDPLFFKFSAQSSFNTQVTGRRKSFLVDDGGGVSFWGFDDGNRSEQPTMADWTGDIGPTGSEAPIDYKWSFSVGGNEEIDEKTKLGGFVSFFYERDSSFRDDAKDDRYWIEQPGGPYRPQQSQGSAQEGSFFTSLFDVTRAQVELQWGGLATVGIETENHKISALFLYSRTVTDTALLLEDTRGKEYYFPGHDPNDPTTPGHVLPPADPLDPPDSALGAAPYLRFETLNYTERQTGTLQFTGHHEVPVDDLFSIGDAFQFKGPKVDWTIAHSFADQNQPDKRQFSTFWTPRRDVDIGGGNIFTIPQMHQQLRPSATINLGNLQRIYKKIEETSNQIHFNLEFPFEQWGELDGYFKIGGFRDKVTRLFDQDTYSNAGDFSSTFEAPFETPWSAEFPFEAGVHPIVESQEDIDYTGNLTVQAWYLQMRLPVLDDLTLTGGVRFEQTKIRTVNDAETLARWVPPGSSQQFSLDPPDIADVALEQFDVLPSIGLEYNPFDDLTIRASYNETVARQTFKEITPILQQEFVGGPIFIGNPGLTLSFVQSYDFRVDWRPYDGWLVSGSWFRKDIQDPIEYVQRVGNFNFTTARNYPKGVLQGFEFEVRADLGRVLEELEGLTVGGNVTFIDATVDLPEDEVQDLADIGANITDRDMVNAPEHLYNIFATYEVPDWGTKLALFYSVTGDQLIAGAGEANGNFVPSVYATEFGTLNFTLSQALGDHFSLRFQAKNLTDPKIQTVYRRDGDDKDVVKTTYTAGIEFSLKLSAEFTF